MNEVSVSEIAAVPVTLTSPPGFTPAVVAEMSLKSARFSRSETSNAMSPEVPELSPELVLIEEKDSRFSVLPVSVMAPPRPGPVVEALIDPDKSVTSRARIRIEPASPVALVLVLIWGRNSSWSPKMGMFALAPTKSSGVAIVIGPPLPAPVVEAVMSAPSRIVTGPRACTSIGPASPAPLVEVSMAPPEVKVSSPRCKVTAPPRPAPSVLAEIETWLPGEPVIAKRSALTVTLPPSPAGRAGSLARDSALMPEPAPEISTALAVMETEPPFPEPRDAVEITAPSASVKVRSIKS